METPARDALIKLATNSSLTRDASVLQDLSDQQKEKLEKDTELSELKRKRDCFRTDLIASHHQLHKARSTELLKEFTKAKNEVRAKKRKLHKTAKDIQLCSQIYSAEAL
jgi:hypothetical protein